MKFRELFYSDYYNIAFRNKKEDKANSDREWTVVKSSNHEWFADPFLFQWGGKHFIFAERMNVWQTNGTLAYCEVLDDGTTSPFKEVLTEPFHLSYPNVFEYSGSVYMIPETGHNKDIRLYKAVQFPDKWTLVKSFWTGANFVDTSFVSGFHDGIVYLCSYDWGHKSSHFYKFDLKDLSLSELPNNPNMQNERSGGNLFEERAARLRVLQDCSQTYGAKIIINRIECDDFEAGKASDTFDFEILPQNLRLNSKGMKPKCCHTYNQIVSLEVVDFLAERFVWFQPFLILRRKIRSAYYKVLRLF